MEPKSLPRFGVRLVLVASTLAWLLPGSVAWAQKKAPITTIRVSVTVLNNEGKPLPGAGVVLRQATVDQGRMAKDPFNVELHTDTKGQIQVQGFQPGIVLVQVIAHGFQTYGQAFIMKQADEAVHVKLKLPRSQVTIYH